MDQDRVGWRGRTHFFAVGARMMRRVLVDHARRVRRRKRGGDRLRLTFDDAARPAGLDPEEVLDLDAAITELAQRDPRQARVVELRYYGGLKVDEVAQLLGVSPRTVKGEWAHAQPLGEGGMGQVFEAEQSKTRAIAGCIDWDSSMANRLPIGQQSLERLKRHQNCAKRPRTARSRLRLTFTTNASPGCGRAGRP